VEEEEEEGETSYYSYYSASLAQFGWLDEEFYCKLNWSQV
jgi:hypothetical protein